MGTTVTITINGRTVQSRDGATVLEAADAAGIYIPRLCHHPDLPHGPETRADSRVYRHGEVNADRVSGSTEYDGCGICAVEVEGKGLCLSCTTRAREGMVVHTDTAAARDLRKDNLAQVLARHPHACLLCAERDGCDREDCTEGVEKQERCCARFDDCEYQKICEYVGIRSDVSQYVYRDMPVVETPLFTMDPNLCVGCTRCVRACEKTQGRRVIGFVYHHGEFVLGTTRTTHKESGCVFCGACVSVCPTGALADRGLPWKKRAELRFTPVRLPPQDDQAFTEENIARAPEASGVYQLFDEENRVICIRGSDNMRRDLQEQSRTAAKARSFRCEEHGMYTMRETEMLEAFLKKHGRLPEVNDEIADLY